MNPAKDALDLLRAGDWDASHNLIQDHSDSLSCLVHALLHRHEGDLDNADYWYRQAGEVRPDNNLGEEWQRLMDLTDSS